MTVFRCVTPFGLVDTDRRFGCAASIIVPRPTSQKTVIFNLRITETNNASKAEKKKLSKKKWQLSTS
jgi:hypothetical protein